MVQQQEVEAQLQEAGVHFRFFGRPEIRELAKILLPGEKIARATNGFYEGGFALLAVTDQRLLLVDKKPMFLTIEDVRFDMIAEIDYNHRLLNATARIFSTNKTVIFTSWTHARLRALTDYLQQQVMILRHQHASAVGEHIHNRMQEQFAQMQQAAAHYIPAIVTPIASEQPNASASYRDQTPEVVPTLAHVAMQSSPGAGANSHSTVNPYAAKIPVLSRRRKFPSFY